MNSDARSPISLLEEEGSLPLPVGQEPVERIKDILDGVLEEDEGALQITSPYGAEKVSTNQRKRASFNRLDERSVEEAVRNLSPNVDSLKMVITGPGGRISSANKIARSINNNFERVETYVPHFAKSGATLVSLVGDEIVMGEMSDLGPLDPQTGNREERYSTTDLTGAYERWLQEWENKHPSEASAPEHSMMDRMDILEYEEAKRLTETMVHYAIDILSDKKEVSNEEAEEAAQKLVGGYPIHGYTLTAGEAQETLPAGMVIPADEKQDEMTAMRKWMDNYAFDTGSNHVVVYHH